MITIIVAVIIPPRSGDKANGVLVRELLHALSAGQGGWGGRGERGGGWPPESSAAGRPPPARPPADCSANDLPVPTPLGDQVTAGHLHTLAV